jgi:prepilin-type processing-associated H-X9-DG protein
MLIFAGPAIALSGCGLSTVMNCTNDNETYSFHTNGCNFLFGDGSVNFITESVDLDTYISLITKAADDIAKDRP